MAHFSIRPPLDRAAENGYGVPVEGIKEGIEHGVRNINIDTDIRIAMADRYTRGEYTALDA